MHLNELCTTILDLNQGCEFSCTNGSKILFTPKVANFAKTIIS